MFLAEEEIFKQLFQLFCAEFMLPILCGSHFNYIFFDRIWVTNIKSTVNLHNIQLSPAIAKFIITCPPALNRREIT